MEHGNSHTETGNARINEVLTRGVDRIVGEEELRADLSSGRVLRVKLGIDPTSPNIHIGRSVVLLKLRDFQELGHHIILIVGDATGLIGDTSDKESERPMLTEEQVRENMDAYRAQAATILDMERVEVRYNSEWLNTLTFKEIGAYADAFSVADFIARDNIKRRLSSGSRVSLREMLYPLLQGYDSVYVRADLEIGGSDQWFNLLAGRTLQEHLGMRPQYVLTTNLIPGLDGRKMSSSWGNTVNITDAPSDMYGKIMSIPDDQIEPYFVHATRVPLSEIASYTAALESGSANPRDIKMKLAHAITALYHNDDAADTAARSFAEVFQKRGVPEEMPTVSVASGTPLVDALLVGGVIASKTEGRRLVAEGAVSFPDTGQKASDPHMPIERDCIVKAGKRRFLSITVA